MIATKKACAGCGMVHDDLGKLPLISYAGARWHASGAVAVEVRRCTCDQPIAREVPMPWAADVFEERPEDLKRAHAGVDHRDEDPEKEWP